MPQSSITLPSGELTVYAKEEKNLPSLTNQSGKTITLKIEAEGKWSYGGKDAFANQVNGDGNTQKTGRNPYMRFPEITPAALVAVKNNQAVAKGKEQTIELLPGETVSFINNDQPGVYNDNSGSLTIKWSIASIRSSSGNIPPKKEPVNTNDLNTDIVLPVGEFLVAAYEETTLPTLTNESNQKIGIQIQAVGNWNYGNDGIFAKQVDGNGNYENAGRQSFMRFPNLTPAALVAVKNNQAVASGKQQIVELQSGETVSFINNDQPGVYHDNSGILTVNWSIVTVG